MAGSPVWRAALRALMMAFSTNVVPVSSASGTSNCDCGSTSMSSALSISPISRSLPGLPLASTTFFIPILPGFVSAPR